DRRKMTRAEWPRLLAGAAMAAGLFAFVVTNLRITTDITHFLPSGENDAEVDLARSIATGELSRTMILLVDVKDRVEAAAVSRAFEADLLAEPRVAPGIEFLDGGPPAGIDEALWNTYEPRRLAFLADSPEAATARLTDEGLAAAVAHLKQRLASPMSGLLSRVAPGDPFLIVPTLFDRLIGGRGNGLGIEDDRFVTDDGTAAVLFLTTRASASDASAQRPLLEGVHAAFGTLQQTHGAHLRLSMSGVHRHAIAAEASMRADIQRVTIGSIAGLVTLFVLLFLSVRPLIMCLPVLGTGFLAGTTACLLAYGEVHGLTLAFGSSLLGVSIDYSVHFYSHQALAPDARGPRQTLARLWNSLLLGAGTTAIGFLALMVATFPGLRELALFAVVGIAATLAATNLFLPGFAGSMRPTPAARMLVKALRGLVPTQDRRRLGLAAPIVAVLALIAIGLPQARWDDSLATLNRVDPALKAEDDAVHARVARFEQRRVVVATGSDEQAALAANDRVAEALRAAERAGEIGGFGNAAGLVPSAAQQRAVDAAVRGDPTLWPRLRAALTAAGFVATAFEPFATALAAAPPAPVTIEDLLGTPLAALVRPFHVDGPRGVSMLSFLHELGDEPALRLRLARVEGARLIDIEGALTNALGAYRARMQTLLLYGVVAVVLLVVLRLRALRATLLACVPALLAAAGTIAVLALASVPMNLLSLVALLMIFSMGVDYGIFLAAPEHDAAAVDATNLSVVVASLTTVLGFGLLAMSVQPPLLCIGLTSGVGILLCVVLALSLGGLLGPSEQRSRT
ncbi:MAG TPA: MMPL family transporter, partial [Planctomycetota bacterium]|nr:MMPL family transporter [Planctomycetota bacterium]